MTEFEIEIVCKAIAFEMKAIEKSSSERNPFKATLKKWNLWEKVEKALEGIYNT